jgi:protein-L-isoaspartate(D-aspartate) O-methyltransferase
MTTWTQANLHLAPETSAEPALTEHILPAMARLAPAWWFIRKDPVRLRWSAGSDERLPADIAAAFDALQPAQVTSWNLAVYEPEIGAFGGADAMTAAHVWFCADSRHLATALTIPDFAGHRATYAMLLAVHLMRAAGLDWWEQGDVWAKLTVLRPRTTPDAERHHSDVEALITRDPWQRPNPRLEPHSAWFDAATQLGETLAHLAALGRTSRGLRALLAQHLVHHWNRIGLPSQQQGDLVAATRATVFGTTIEEHP